MRERTAPKPARLPHAGRALRIALAVVVLAGMTGCANASRAAGEAGASAKASARARSVPFQRPKITPSPPTRQPRNTGFEQGSYKRCPYTWTCKPIGKASFGVVTGTAKAGKFSMLARLTDAKAAFVLRSEAVPAQPNRSYTARILVKSSVPDREDSAESIRLRFYDKKRAYIGSGNAFSGQPSEEVWQTLRASAQSPTGTAFVAVEVTLRGGPRSLWLDSAQLRDSPILHVWPNTGVRREDKRDTLTMQLTTPTPGGVRIGTVDAFGTRLHVAGAKELVTRDGGKLAYSLSGAAEYEPKTMTVRVRPGSPATMTIVGRFTPTPGTNFPRVVLTDPVAKGTFSVYMGASNFKNKSSGFAIPDRLATLQSVQRLSKYLDGLRDSRGGWKISHPYWPGQLRRDPQGIATLTQGYLNLMRASDDKAYGIRARQGLDFLVQAQRKDGGFGLPWAFGSRTGHFGGPEHYEKGHRAHPENAPLAIVTIAAGNALLQGYTTFGDKRYLDAANQTMNYLLRDKENGFRWLDKKFTRGSVPYCDLEPILPDDDPRVAKHDVLPSLKNTSVEVFNIDASTLSFIVSLYQETGDKRLLTYGDAIATNLASKIRDDGSVPYSWYESSPHSAGYASIAYRGLLEYGEFRGRDEWRESARRGYIWLANEGSGLIYPPDSYTKVYGTDRSLDIADFVRTAVERQRPNGAFSDGSKTRHDAVMFAILSNMLVEMGG